MLPQQLEALQARARETLESGGSIAVFGWTGRHHNESTKGLVATKRVVFYSARQSKRAGNLNASFGLGLFTRFVGHSGTTNGPRKRSSIHPTPLEVREIREILASCADLLNAPLPLPDEEDHREATATGPPPRRVISLEQEALDLEVLDFLTTPRKVMPMDPMIGFADRKSVV